ncbi:hypothetical protein ACHWQZ_G005949 [Mnemiopsis leidyi]
MSNYLSVLSYVAAAVVIPGLLTNTLSLSFFLQRKAPSPGTVLLISLNMVDILVCVFSLATWVHSFWFLDNVEQTPPVSFQALLATSDIMMKTTMFITCLLTITRTLYLIKPLVKIRTPCILTQTALFLVYEILFVSLAFTGEVQYRYYWLELAILSTLLTVLIVVSGLVSVLCLLPATSTLQLGSNTTGPGKRRNVDTSITVLILAGLFCFFNVPFCVIHIWEFLLGPGSLYGSVHNYDVYVFTYSLCVPLNSALNPVVYFVRNSKLRHFVLDKLCCRKGARSGWEFVKSEKNSTRRVPGSVTVIRKSLSRLTVTAVNQTISSPFSTRKSCKTAVKKNRMDAG